MHSVVEDVLRLTKKRVVSLKEDFPPITNGRSLEAAIRAAKDDGRVPVIAEVKPASPTSPDRGINPEDAADIARGYARGGACAVSVLTEPHYFKGSIENLRAVRNAVGIPVLRKDFIIDPRQLGEVETDAILLITRVLGPDIGVMVDLASKVGFEPLVEIHTADEARNVLDTGVGLVGINNRDLGTLEVDLSTTEKIAPLVAGGGRIVVSESGMYHAVDVKRMLQVGADAVLVGTALMDEPELIEELVNAGR